MEPIQTPRRPAMIKRGKYMEFLHWIKEDGTELVPCNTPGKNPESNYPKTDDMSYLDTELLTLSVLSLVHRTYIARDGDKFWIVKLK